MAEMTGHDTETGGHVGPKYAAADCYRKVIEFTRANPEDYDAGFVNSFLQRIAQLEACAIEADRAVRDADRLG